MNNDRIQSPILLARNQPANQNLATVWPQYFRLTFASKIM